MENLIKITEPNTEKTEYMTYFSLLTDASLRKRLIRKMEENPTTHMFCCCSSLDDREFFLSPDGKLLFPKGIPHTSSCVQNIRNTVQLTEGALSPFLSEGGAIPVSFSWRTRTRKRLTLVQSVGTVPEKKEEPFSMEALVLTMNTLAFQKAATQSAGITLSEEEFREELMRHLLFDVGQLTLKSPKDELLLLSVSKLLSPKSRAGDIYFLYARVTRINDTYNRYIYLRVQSVSGASITITIDRSVWGSLTKEIMDAPYVNGTPLWIAGLVETKILKSYKRGTYDTYTWGTSGGELREYKANILRQGILFYTSNYGLLCLDAGEVDFCNFHMEKGDVVNRILHDSPERMSLISISSDGTVSCHKKASP